MTGSRAEQLRRNQLLDDLAREIAAAGGPVRTRHRRTLRRTPFLTVRTTARRGRLQIYCISEASGDAFLTDDGRLIVLDPDAGLRGVARQLTGAAYPAPGAAYAAGHAAPARTEP